MNFFIPIFRLFLLCTLLASCAMHPPMEVAKDKDQEISKKLTEMSGQIAALSADVGTIKQTLLALQKGPQDPPPFPPVSQVEFDDDPVRGNANAKVAIVEFSDYECPFCGRFHAETLPSLKKDYIDTGKVQYIFRDFPLDFHRNAISASVAANCAGEQNAYWEMHDSLFVNQKRLGKALYDELVKTLKLKPVPFDACLKEAKQAKEVASDFAYGQSVGVEGTPTFFVGRIDGKKLVDVTQIVGAQPPAIFAKAIESLLNKPPTK